MLFPIAIFVMVAVSEMASSMPLSSDASDTLTADLYVGGQTPEPHHSTAPVELSRSVLMVGAFCAFLALFTALASQKATRSASPRSSPESPRFSESGGKVRWTLGDNSSDDESNSRASSMYGSPKGHTKAAPSYDGCYWMADPTDDPPSPDASRRNTGQFHY
eukprot:m.126245 g.126245  ORF g.126245 m.126245 type:complete len:162 (-) comp17365_c0_seq1:227-712(-)